MRPFNNLAENKILPVVLKLLHDLLFLLLLFFALSLIAEGILPGIISRHFSLSRTVILLLGNVFLITILGNFLKIKSIPKATNKKMILVISFFGIILILNSLLKINFFLNFFLTAMALGTAYLFYLVITQEKE